MTADTSGATQDYSTRPARAEAGRRPVRRAIPSVHVLRAVLGLVALVGIVLLVVSTFATVVEITVLTTTELANQDTQLSGGDLHGVALVLVAIFALVMLLGALRGARPAMLALASSGLLALGLIVGLDVPELDNTGQLARFYEDVSAGAASGFYFETLGAVLLLLAGGGLFLLTADAALDRVEALGRGAAEVGARVGAGARGARGHGGQARRRRADTTSEEPEDAAHARTDAPGDAAREKLASDEAARTTADKPPG